jgi:Protein of unknown function (DUF2442)
MKSEQHGVSTSQVEVGNVTRQGFWLLLDDREFFLPFQQFPWFRNASIEGLTTIERPSPHHLYWPTLDVDLAVDSIVHPERYPLLSRGTV